MSRTAFKFLRDMWRHLAAMSLVLALMVLTLLALERAATKPAPTSADASQDIHYEAVEQGNAADLGWLTY